MNTIIKLCNCFELDLNYNHTPFFQNRSQQLTYFNSKILYNIDDTMYQKKNNDLKVEYNIDKLRYCNYVIINNNDEMLFYFVLDRIYINEITTNLILKLDVIQTYITDIKFSDCLIEREHIYRWLVDGNNNKIKPNLPLTDESLEVGDYEIKNIHNIYDYSSKGSFIISSSDRLGISNDGRPKPPSIGGNPEPPQGNGGNWQDGKISKNGFRFIKGYEAFAPYKYKDSGGYWTIAYGVTKHGEPSLYEQLVLESPITEERASKVSYDLKNNNYGSKILDTFKKLGLTEQYQFDALLDLAYNCGNSVVVGGGDTDIIEAIKRNPNDENYIRNVWENFYISDGENAQEGLRLRRIAECNIFFNKGYEFRAIPTIGSDGFINGVVTENDGNGWLPKDNITNNLLQLENELGKFSCPSNGIISATFPTYDDGSPHNGIDIANNENTPTFAMRDGIVTISGWVSGYGNCIYITHTDGIETRYGHHRDNGLLVSVGDNVKEGQQIGKMGTTGNSTGNHLHFEIRKNGIPIQPSNKLQVGDKV